MRHPQYVAIREGGKNILARPWTTAALSVATFAMAIGLFVVAHVESVAVTSQQDRLVARGAYVLQIYGAGGVHLPAQRCDQLNSIDGVIAAGGIVSSASIDLRLAEDVGTSIVEVTPGMLRVLWPQISATSPTGVATGSSVTTHFGLTPGARLLSSDPSRSNIAVRHPATSPARLSAFDTSVVVPVPPLDTVQDCYVESTPETSASVLRLARTWFDEALRAEAVAFFTADLSDQTPQDRLDSRISSWLALAVGFGCLGAVLLGWRARKAEFALYASLGMRVPTIFTILIVECVAVLLVPIGVAALASILILKPEPLEMASIFAAQIKLVAIALLAVPAGLASVWPRQIASALKDSN